MRAHHPEDEPNEFTDMVNPIVARYKLVNGKPVHPGHEVEIDETLRAKAWKGYTGTASPMKRSSRQALSVHRRHGHHGHPRA